MKLFHAPILSMSLLMLCLLSGLATPTAYAEFTFGTPVSLGPTVNTGAGNYRPCVSPDGLELYFNRDDGEIYVARRETPEGEWTTPVKLGPTINSPSYDVEPCLSADGLSLYFTSDRPGTLGNFDLWVTTRATVNDDWGTPINLGAPVNSAREDGGASISADGLELYFNSSNRPGGYGSRDLWVTTRATVNDNWGTPVNLGPAIHTSHSEAGPTISPDGLVLFFSSSTGTMDSWEIYMTRRATRKDAWGPRINLGPPVNSATWELGAEVSHDGSMFYWDSPRLGAFSGCDIWQAPIIPIVDFNGDGKVDGKDVLCMVAHWGTSDPLCDIGPFAWGDGTVGLEDLTVLAGYLGKEVTDPTLTAHWTLDETRDCTAHESISGCGDVILGNPLWRHEGGQVGDALQLDGVGDCIATHFVLNPAEGPFSVLAWIKGGAPGRVVISEPGYANWLIVGAEGKLMTELMSPSRDGIALQSQTIITDGQWHRIGLVWDGSRRSLYVDGVVAAEDTQSALPSSGNGLYIGTGKNMEAGTFWSGLIDDVRIYSRAVRP